MIRHGSHPVAGCHGLQAVEEVTDELDTLAEECADSKRKHVEQAYETVAFHAEKPFSLLPDGLRDALEGDDHSSGR